MDYTLVYYNFVLLLMVVFTILTPDSIYGRESKVGIIKYWGYLLPPILLYSLFWGLRENVGADFPAYKMMYLFPSSAFAKHTEVGYQWLNQILAHMGFGYWSIFIVTSALTIIAIYYLGRRHGKSFTVALVYFFFTSTLVFSAQNGIRQHMAINFILIGLALIPIAKNKILPLAILITASILVHKSAVVPWIIFLIIYFAKKMIINKYVLITLVFACNILRGYLYQYVFGYFDAFFTMLDYAGYYERFNEFKMDQTLSSGFGVILKHIIYLIVIWNQELFIKKNKTKDTAYIAYCFFIIAIICEPIFSSHMILNRMVMYFSAMKFVVYAFAAKALWSRITIPSKSMAVALYIITFMLFNAAILSNSNYVVPYEMVSLDNFI